MPLESQAGGDTLGSPLDERGFNPPENDIYHEFGTVTPGGGARRGPPRHGIPGVNSVPDMSGMVIGPGGVVKPPPRDAKRAAPKPTLQEKQAQIRKALVPMPALAVARRKTLDDLYARLAGATDEEDAKGTASLIIAVWQRSGSDTANLLMSRADTAIGSHDYPLAASVLDRLVELQPDWAEAWNKRATVRFLANDLDGSMADVDRVLKLEPKHFAALNGLAIILQRTGFNKRALDVYRHELAIYPHQPAIKQIVDKLTLEVDGQGI